MTNPTSETRVEADGAIVTITIDRDHKCNSLTVDTRRDIADAVEVAAGVPEQRVILPCGEGRVFCVGADLSGQHHEDSFHEQLRRMLRTIEAGRLVVIADVQGPAVGAGMQLAMAADLRVVGERGWFMIPPVKLGIAVDAWTIRRVYVLVGGVRARTIPLAVERMDQETAHGCGLTSYLGGPNKTEEVALRTATYAPLSLAYHKATLNDDETHSPLKDYQQELYGTIWASEDVAEASKARAEKREPNLIGKQVEQVQQLGE